MVLHWGTRGVHLGPNRRLLKLYMTIGRRTHSWWANTRLLGSCVRIKWWPGLRIWHPARANSWCMCWWWCSSCGVGRRRSNLRVWHWTRSRTSWRRSSRHSSSIWVGGHVGRRTSRSWGSVWVWWHVWGTPMCRGGIWVNRHVRGRSSRSWGSIGLGWHVERRRSSGSWSSIWIDGEISWTRPWGGNTRTRWWWSCSWGHVARVLWVCRCDILVLRLINRLIIRLSDKLRLRLPWLSSWRWAVTCHCWLRLASHIWVHGWCSRVDWSCRGRMVWRWVMGDRGRASWWWWVMRSRRRPGLW